MAERHGAKVTEEMDLDEITHLIYRPGYERSEKVRRAFAKKNDIHVVPISWFLDSLLQSRPIHEAMVSLKAIPDTPTPVGKGTVLPHHGHPFYAANAEDYEILTPEEREAMKQETEALRQEAASKGAARRETSVVAGSSAAAGGAAGGAADMRTVPPLPQFGPLKTHRTPLAQVQCSKHLFTGISFVFSPSCETEGFPLIAKEHGAREVRLQLETSAAPMDLSTATHVVYHNSDKKSSFMLDAVSQLLPSGSPASAAAPSTVAGGAAFLVSQQWFEDCLLMNERIPELGPYTPSEKLLTTLQKKKAKQ